MNTLIYIPTGLASPELEILLAKAQSSIDTDERTTIVTCAGGPGYACSFNIYGLPSICGACKAQTQRGVALLKGEFTHVKTPEKIEVSKPNAHRKLLLKSRWAIKAHRVDNADVGQAAYSSYIGKSRDQDLEGCLAERTLNRLLTTSEQLLVWFNHLLQQTQTTKVYLYNGRQNQYRPLLRAAQQRHIPVNVMEFSGQYDRCTYTFKNELPQDLDLLNEYIEDTWRRFKGNIHECAEYYYQFKRAGGIINDTQNKSYVLEQTQGLLPEDWDASKHNIAVFNSSEDEYAAVGGDYDHTLYKNQSEAMTRLCDALHDDNDIVIWLRIHPNLKDVHWGFAKQLLRLGKKHSNVRVIPGDSKVSSYALLDACNTAVSFGSTMGIEAVYWGKPSILIGRCVYERLGSVYTPKTHEEAVTLMRDRHLPPLPIEGALKTAVFWTWGGNPIPYFSGTRKDGFAFNGHRLNKMRLEQWQYNLGKFIERYLLGSINYIFGSTRARLSGESS